MTTQPNKEIIKNSVLKALLKETASRINKNSFFLHEPTETYISSKKYYSTLCMSIRQIIEQMFDDDGYWIEQFRIVSPEEWASFIIIDCLKEETEFIEAVLTA